MRIALLLFLLAATSIGNFLVAEPRVEETDILRSAYENILELELDSAVFFTEQSRLKDPDNLLVELIESYSDFLRGFINEDEESLERFRKSKSKRLARLEKVTLDSPYLDFMQAEIHLQWALVRSKHKEYLRAGWDINKAYKLLTKCQKEYPDFVLADKSLSVIHALVGSIQGFRRGLMRIFTSLDGSIEDGLSEIDNAMEETSQMSTIWRPEIVIIKSLLLRHIEHDPAEALSILKQLGPITDKSPLVRFLMGACARDLGDNAGAIEYWSWEQTEDQLPFYYMDLLKGIALLNNLDHSADKYFLKYIKHHSGIHYQKEARQKMAWYELLINNNRAGYGRWMRACKKEGSMDFGEDQQAYQEAKLGIIPSTVLLKSRLLYDGGLYDKALLELSKGRDFSNAELLEYHYRKARIFHAREENRDAILEYSKVLIEGANDQRYYACNAALQIGIIMSDLNRTSQAQHYFERCLLLNPEEYRESLHQKARMGLQKLRVSN